MCPHQPRDPRARRQVREKKHHMKLSNFVAGKFKKMEVKEGLVEGGRNNPALDRKSVV